MPRTFIAFGEFDLHPQRLLASAVDWQSLLVSFSPLFAPCSSPHRRDE
jgi:hypothetical protein